MCARDCSACLLRAGVWLPRDGASSVPEGQSEGLRRQVLGACGHLNPVKLSSKGCMENLPQITKSQG